MQALTNESSLGKKVSIAARGLLTIPALFSFALKENAASLYLAGGLVSYRSVLETEEYQQSIANFGWKLFEYTDLPLVAAGAASRHIHLAGTVNAANQPMLPDAVRLIYPDSRIQISAEPAWDEVALTTA